MRWDPAKIYKASVKSHRVLTGCLPRSPAAASKFQKSRTCATEGSKGKGREVGQEMLVVFCTLRTVDDDGEH